MKIRPLYDRVIVESLTAEEKTAGGIIIPDTAQEKPSEGTVVAVGPGTRGKGGKFAKLDVKTGDRILYGKWSGTEVTVEGKDLLIVRESDVLAILGETAVVHAKAKAKVAAAGGGGHVHIPGDDCCD